jgi:hypothetical protein
MDGLIKNQVGNYSRFTGGRIDWWLEKDCFEHKKQAMKEIQIKYCNMMPESRSDPLLDGTSLSNGPLTRF